ncbi:MAG TPA: heme biosynthesis HemY N-terminal domain-containing protein [Gallionella sp.]
MKYLMWILGLFAAAVALTMATHNSGYVLLVYPPYRIELSLTLFVVLLVLGFVCGYALVRLFFAVYGLPAHVREYHRERAQAKSREVLDKMLGAFFEGRYAAAENIAARAIESGESSVIYPVIAARSAHELREYKKRDAYLSAAEGRTIGDSTMRLVTASKFMLDQRDPQSALKALHELRDSGIKGHSGVMTLELKAQQQAGNWDEVLRLLDQLEKRESLDVTVALQFRQQAWLEKIRAQPDLASLKACLKSIPADYRRHSKFAATAARALIKQGGCAQAQQLLTDSLNAQWDSELVAIYGDCHSDGTVTQIEQAEKWLKLHRQDAGLLLALGKLCLHQKLWGKAQNYLDASISLQPSREAYTTLGQLAERLGKMDEAARHYQYATAIGNR